MTLSADNLQLTNFKSPNLPALLSFPCKFLPSKIHSQFLTIFLNRLLAEQIKEGDLEFLSNKCLCVNVVDAKVKYFISLKKNILVPMSLTEKSDIEIKATVFDFLQLAARQQDPDTLVFQRRLVMQGNTELGLEVKNFLDGLDLESSFVFSKIESFLKKSLPVYSRLFS